MKPVRTTIGLCLAFVALVLGLFVFSINRAGVLSEEELRARGVLLLPTPREIAEFELLDQHGQPFGVAALRDHWSFLFFGFTNCPDICPTSMSVLAQARRALVAADPAATERFQAVLVSVDPERDTAEVLGAYVGAFSEDFLGVRGEVENVAGLAENVNVAFAKVPVRDGDGNYDPDLYQVDHTANIVIVNPRGHYHGLIKYPQQADTIVAAYQTLDADF